MGTFYFYYQNPLVFCFPLQIRAFVIQISLELPNLKMKENTKSILVLVVTRRHRANGLLR